MQKDIKQSRQKNIQHYFKNYSEDVILWEVLKIKTIQKLRFKFISTNSIHRQGFRIAIDAGDGEITINGTCSKAFDLWEDTCPNEVVITCNSSEGFLSIYNIFEKLEGWGKVEDTHKWLIVVCYLNIIRIHLCIHSMTLALKHSLINWYLKLNY